MSVSRRDFLGAGAAAAAGLALPKLATGACRHITVTDRAELIPKAFAGRPVIISATNGYNATRAASAGSRSPGI